MDISWHFLTNVQHTYGHFLTNVQHTYDREKKLVGGKI